MYYLMISSIIGYYITIFQNILIKVANSIELRVVKI